MVIDRQNIDRVFDQYKDNLFAIAFNYFRNPMDAEDAVQETFVRLLRTKDGGGREFDSQEHLRSWLIRVVLNECKRVTLSSFFKRRVSLEDYAQTLTFEAPEESQVFDAVMHLPQKYRSVLHLYYYENYSVREIAKLLHISETAATTRLSRGRQKLKQKLLEVWQDESTGNK